LNTESYILLKKLRSKPVQSATSGKSGLAGDPVELTNLLKSLGNAGNNLVTFQTAYATALKTIQDGSVYASQGLGKLVGMHESFNAELEKVVQNMTFLENRNSTLNKGFGVSGNKAQQYAAKIRDLGKTFGYGDEDLLEYTNQLKELTGGFILSSEGSDVFKKKLIMGQAYMQKNMKLTEEQAASYEQYANGMNNAGVDYAEAMQGLSKKIAKAAGIDEQQAQRDIMIEISALTNDVQLQYSRMPGNLELAVLKAKALGLTMAELKSTGDSLLDIESSVGNELEYQLLTGRRLLVDGKKSLTNEYRMATMRGDANKQAELMNKFLETEGDTLRTNMFARKKASELLGIDEQTLARSLQKQKIANELGIKNLMGLSEDAVKTEIEALRKNYKGENKSDFEAKLNKFLAASDTRTSHEKAVEENLAQIADLISTSVAFDVETVGKSALDLVKSQGIINFKNMLKGKQREIGQLSVESETNTAIAGPIAKIAGFIPGIGTGLNALTSALNAVNKTFTTGKQPNIVAGNDILITPDKGPIIRPAKNDVIAAFRPNDIIDRTLKSTTTQPNGNVNMKIDYNMLAQAISNAMRNVKVEATVKTDNLYAATYLNNRKRFS